MNRMTKFFRGTEKLRVVGLSSESFLNFMAEHRLPFWNVKEESALELSCTVFAADRKRLEQAAAGKGFEITIERRSGILRLMKRCIKRPVFAIGCVLCLFLLCWLPRFVWTVEIEGNEMVEEEEIRRAMDDYGVHFGADGKDIDSQMLQAKIMNEIPALRWCAVNQKGGCVTISVSERETVPESEVDHTLTNVIAVRDGVVTKTEIYGGFRRCRVGQAVKKGELLISGSETFEKSTQITHAYGEIYALTQREITAKTPLSYTEKQYTGKSDTHYSVILGRKRINLFGNSGIPQGSCDKIIRRSQLTLPGGYLFPVWIEEETRIYYTSVEQSLDKKEAQDRLSAYIPDSAEQQMIAGQILAQKNQIKQMNDCWVMHATLSCEEMISRIVPWQFEESETEDGGTNH